MDPKSTVVKSKSSHSAISKKSKEHISRKYDKKSRSSADFPCHSLKKRGVYVEKRLTKMNLVNNSNENDCVPQKAPPRPRPGQKTFLASVLTILSKSTTGTQYPELNEESKRRKRREHDIQKDIITQNIGNENVVVQKDKDHKNSKEKFKSRVLNKKFVKEDTKKMVILKSKKEISQTPSNYSEWSYKDASRESNNLNKDNSNDMGGLNIADELKNAVLEGRNPKVNKLKYIQNEPQTLVSDDPNVQKNLYKFFVDLLETTISVYNVQAEYDGIDASDSSKTNLQINESVANKLNIGKIKKTVEFEDGVLSPQNFNYLQSQEGYEDNFINKPVSVKRNRAIKTPKAKKLKADSLLYCKNIKTLPQKSRSVEIKHKTTFRNKNELINVLKQELKMDTNTFEEPKSIFQALRVIARNKKKHSFDSLKDYKTYTDECILKQRKVISSRKHKKNNKANNNKNKRETVKPMYNTTDYVQVPKKLYTKFRNDGELDDSGSYHSLEVYNFDYELKTPKQSHFSKPSDFLFTYHSSSSHSDIESNLREPFLRPVDTVSSIKKFSAVVD